MVQAVTESRPLIEFRVHPGPQQDALASEADIVIFGGGVGGGKTWALLFSIIQYAQFSEFAAEIFRRTYPQLTMTGGVWPESFQLFPRIGGVANLADLRWTFPSGATVKFSHMQHPTDRLNWDGAQIPMIGWDQLESFEETQFWYLLSRNRAPRGGVRPWVFATCNPVPDTDATGGWLHRLVQWWIDPARGVAIPERSGTIRWVVRRDDTLHWAGTRDALLARHPERDPQGQLLYEPKSITFIASKLEDNPTLMQNDPGYLSRIMLMPFVERERLTGNWNVRPTAGSVFNRSWFTIVDAAPADARRVRYWDLAATEGAGDWTAGVKICKSSMGMYYVEHVIRGQWSAYHRNRVIRQTAESDGLEAVIWIPQDPGSGGKEAAEILLRELAGFTIRAETVTGNKITRAGPFASQAEAENVKLVRGEWNE
ncbi:MAG: terminase family protein, partial [bacterium]|nr:terminase family protein [bacterium]